MNPVIIEMLEIAEKVFSSLNIEFYLVGATARDLHLSKIPDHTPKRKTDDVDIAINIGHEKDFHKLKDALLQTGEFTAHETDTIKLFFRESIELDLLPFGEIENEERETRIEKPHLFIMDMPGFKELEPYVQVIQIEETDLKIVSLEGLILLKLFAYDDDSSRTKDITDIDYIIEVYFDLESEMIWEDHLEIMNLYPTDNVLYLQLVSARIIGRKLRSFLLSSPQLLSRIQSILTKRPTEQWQAVLDGLNDN